MKFWVLKKNYLLVIILVIAAVVRFAGITWAFPFSPHPDEWNMAAAITRLDYKISLDPKFYAYGQFPLYLSYFSAIIYNLISWVKIQTINIQEAIFFLRFWSAVAGVGTVYLVYLISRKLSPNRYHLIPILASSLAALTPGLIQSSHFGTTESLLSFFFLVILYCALEILSNPRRRYFIFSGIFLGLAVGTKISALVFSAPFLLASVLALIKFKSFRIKILLSIFSTALFSISFAIISSPYLLINFEESKRILLYEAQIATGQINVFYTRQFFDTIPVLFQIEKIFPYALGWPIFILGSLGFIVTLVLIFRKIIQRKKFSNFEFQLLIFNFAFLTYFLSQAFLFCKWTRFLSPIFAFFPIFAGIFLSRLSNLRYLRYLLFLLAIAPGIVFSSIYFRPDIRFTASDWIYKNIPSGAKILYDTGNVVDIPVPSKNYQLPITNYQLLSTSFDFYHLDENPELFIELINHLENSDYIFVPSRRVFANHLRQKDSFPLTAKYFELLFSGKLGFKEMKIFRPLPSFQISNFKFQIDDEQSEETFTVFDHPVIRIYKKTVKLTKDDYSLLFKNENI